MFCVLFYGVGIRAHFAYVVSRKSPPAALVLAFGNLLCFPDFSKGGENSRTFIFGTIPGAQHTGRIGGFFLRRGDFTSLRRLSAGAVFRNVRCFRGFGRCWANHTARSEQLRSPPRLCNSHRVRGVVKLSTTRPPVCPSLSPPHGAPSLLGGRHRRPFLAPKGQRGF